MSFNYLKVEDKDSILKLIEKCEEIFDGTLGKYIGSDHTIEL